MNGEDTNALVGPLDSDVAIKSRIFTIRGVQVMLDRDLAELYGVPVKRLNEQVKRNIDRFPESFMFRLSDAEMRHVVSNCDSRSRSQFATLNKGRGGNIKYNPFAFSEHGIIMLASVLKSGVAVKASIKITNTFVAMRKAIASVAPILSRLDVVERRQIADQQRNEERFDTIFKAMDGGEFPPQKVFFDGGTTRRIHSPRSLSARRQRAYCSSMAIATMLRSTSCLQSAAV